MELFELLGKIVVEHDDAIKALQKAQNEGEKTESKLSKTFSAIGKGAAAAGKAIASGLAVGVGAMAGLTVKALQLGGDLEQNMGGAEAVFGELGKTIGDMSAPMQKFNEATGQMEWHMYSLETVSKEAYKNMGLSQSDYLATANKMGALFKGAGFETQEALDLSSQAMQRAADVASIMGIDTEAAMEAVAGAAKGNFTMMDNLGVAMNDTAIAAYAQAQGINKSTSEMTQQEKIGLAMEMFLDKTAYAAGNYAKENETLAGSLSTTKSALTNFLAGSGDVESLVSSFSGLANVIVKNLTEIAPRLTQGISDLVAQIAPMIAPLLQTLLPVLIEGAVSLVNGLVQAMPSIITALLGALPMLIDGIVQMVNAIIQQLPAIMQAICDALPTLIPALIDGICSMIVTLCENFGAIIQPLIDALPDIIISIVEALVNNLPAIIQGLIQLVMSIVEAIPQIIQALVDATPTVISMLIQSLLENLPAIIMGLIQVVWGIVKSLPQIFMSLIEGIGNIFVGIWDGIKNVFKGVGSWFGDVFKGAWEAIKNAWSAVGNFFSNIWKGITNVFKAVGTWFKDKFKEGWNNIKNVWSGVGNFFGGIWDKIKNAFKSVGSWFKNIFSDAWNGIKNVFSKVGSFFGGIWNTIKDKFSALGTKIGDAISGAVKKGINGVLGMIEKVINGFFKLINGAIGLINKIPGVNIKKIKEVKFARLAKGGVVDEATPAIFGEDGAEAIVPLENNTEWIHKTAQDLKKQLAGEGVVSGTSGSVDPKSYEPTGESLVEGLWKGMNKTTNWLGKKITGFSVKVVDFTRKAFGISGVESAVMNNEVGKQLAVGIANGITAESETVETEADKIAQNILAAAEKRWETTAIYNKLSLADEVAYWDAVRVQIAEGTQARISADQKYFELKQSLNDELLSAEKEFQNSMDEIYKKIDDRTSELIGNFSLFEEYAEGNAVPKSINEMNAALDSQIASLEAYDAEMDSLESRIGGTALYDELSKMGVGSLSQIQEINKMTDFQLQQYVDKYNKRAELARGMATEELAEESIAATQQAYQTFADKCSTLGVDVSDNTKAMQDVISSAFSIIGTDAVNATDKITNALDTIINKFKSVTDTLGISSMNFEGTVQVEGDSSGVEWYSKAMDTARILKNPTIFGYNPSSGKYLGGGEAGNEVVAGEQTLMNMIQSAVAEQNSETTTWMQRLFELLASYFPQMLGAMEAPIAFDANSMAATLAVPMNRELGRISSRKDRGR